MTFINEKTSSKPLATMAFSEVVEHLESGRPVDGAEYRPSTAIGSGAAAQPLHEPAYVSPNALSQIYGATAENFGPAITAPSPVAHKPEVTPPPSVLPQDIARELKLRVWHSPDDLIAIRRRFAKTNHPDRVIPSHRDAATTRMSIANTLIDEALRVRDSRT